MAGILPSELANLDAQISAQIDLLRHSNSIEDKILTLLQEMRRELISKLAEGNLTEYSRARLTKLLKESTAVIDGYYSQAQAVLFPSLEQAAKVGASQSVAGLATELTATVPSNAILSTLVTNILIEGAPSADWWSRQSQDTAFRFANAVRQGIAQGDTNEQIFKRVGEVTDLASRNSRALVQTSIMQAASDARIKTIEANKDIYKGFRHLSTLDSRTCWSKETLILLADGTQKKIEEIQEGDYVTGGMSGYPCKVIGKEITIEQSSVEICYNGNIIGRTTYAHRALTRNGWQHIGDICLLSDISEREVLCRGNQRSAKKIQRTRNEIMCGGGICIKQCMEKVRESENVNYCNCGEPFRGIHSGEKINSEYENEGTAWLQHDGRWGGCCREVSGIACRTRAKNIAEIQERPGIQGADEVEGYFIRPESIGSEQAILCHRGRKGSIAQKIKFGVETKDHIIKSERKDAGSNECSARKNEEELGKPRIQGKSEQSTGIEASRVTSEQSAMGGATSRKDVKLHEGKMERSSFSRKDEIEEAASNLNRSENCGASEASENNLDARHEACSCRKDKIRIRKEEEISLGYITGKFIIGEVEIVSLAIEGDTSYVAGGIIVHNTDVCIARSNLEWDLNREPIGHNLPFQAPPIHWNCRSVLMPVRRTFKELGIDLEEPTGRTRSSAEGQIDRETSFDAFLKRRTVEQQDEQLGKGRAELWRSGKITLRQLLDNSGSPLTLKELKEKYG